MTSLLDVSASAVAEAIAAAWFIYVVAQAVHRLYLSPVAKFPGPRLAAVSFWYEFYYDVIQGGQYTFKIKELHDEYGPIIRINPYEIHVATPSFYEKVYAGSGKRRNRWDWFTAQFGIPESMFGAIDHDVHRKRRAAVSPFFSKRAVSNLQPIIDERLNILLRRFQEFQTSHETMTLDYAFSAFTNDIAQEYAFARSDHRLEQHDFEPTFHKAAIAGSTSGAFIKQYPWILPIMTSMPDALMIWLDPNMASYFRLQSDIRKQIREMKSGKRDDSKDADHRTIFYEILNSDLPAKEKSDARLAQDGQISVVGGTITTSWTLCVAAYFLLSQPDTLRKLKAELRQALEGPATTVSIAALEQLPYLTGCIQESLRLSYGASTRLPRIAPDETLVFNDGTKEWLIPPGTPVGMTSYIIHHDESVFPDSFKFVPERWVENPRLDKYMVSFTKGSRQCIGINLAYAELHLVLAKLFRSYGSKEVRSEDDVGYLELFDTDIDDVKLSRDFFLPLTRVGSQGVRIHVMK